MTIITISIQYYKELFWYGRKKKNIYNIKSNTWSFELEKYSNFC